MRFGLLTLLILTAVYAQGQDRLNFGDTEKTNENPTYASKSKDHKQRKTLILVKRNTKKLLEGNKCFEEFQLEKGVKVAFLEKGAPGNYNSISRLLHNTGVRIRGTFRYGPFWVIRLNKKRKECRDALHDFIG